MIGATGFVGRALVPVLARRGEVVAISRRGGAPDVPGVRGLAADVTDSLDGALEGVDVVYHLVHSLGSRDFAELDRRAAENVAAEAERAGVAQIVYLGGLGEDQPGLSSPSAQPDGDGRRPRRPGPFPVTTLRAAVIVGPRQRGVRDDRRAGRPAAGDDRAALALHADAADRPGRRDRATSTASRAARRRSGRASTSAAPRSSPTGEMIKRIAGIRGRRPLILEVPVLSPRLSSYWLHLVTPVRASRRAPADRGPAQPHRRARRPHPRPAPVAPDPASAMPPAAPSTPAPERQLAPRAMNA